jgi:hypothetical protein
MKKRQRLALRLSPPALCAVVLLAAVAETLAGGTPPAPQWTRSSKVETAVSDNGNGTFTYEYTVFNTSMDVSFIPTANGNGELFPNEPVIVDWELPYFDDAGFDLSDVLSPAGWAANIETVGVANTDTGWAGTASWQDPSDPFYFGEDSPFTTATQVLHWYSECWVSFGLNGIGSASPAAVGCEDPLQDAIGAGDTLSDFSLTAIFDETDAPYQASWELREVQSGDPPFPMGLVASPKALGITAAPAPATLALLLLGAAGGFAARRRGSAKIGS